MDAVMIFLFFFPSSKKNRQFGEGTSLYEIKSGFGVGGSEPQRQTR